MPYSDQKYSGYKATLTCGHSRRIKYGSREDQDVIQYGRAFCNKCRYAVALVAAGQPAPPKVLTNGDKVAPGPYSGWIKPDGTFHYVGDAQHYSTAKAMGDMSGGDRFEREGWVHFSYTGIHVRTAVTAAQRDALWDVYQAFQALPAFSKPHQSEYLIHLDRMFKVDPAKEPAFNPDDLWD